MTAQQKVLPALRLQEAIQGVLELSKFKGPAHGEIASYANMAEGDEIKVWVQTSTGNSETYLTVVTQAMVGHPTVLKIRREVFEKNLVPGATAKLGYKVIPVAGNPASSPDLVVKVEQ
ncbi:MAG TPA: hypothetical protein VJ889_13335 [Pseudomonas sp.]|nr:hypothetical protein [Pseudomonas sp.]